MRMLQYVWILLPLYLCTSLAALAQAELELKNGKKMRGELVEQNEKAVTMKVFMGAYLNKIIPTAEIKAITIDGKRHEFIAGTLPQIAVQKPSEKQKAAEPASSYDSSGMPSGVFGFRRDGSGHFPDATPPSEWGASKNLLWKCELPAPSNSSPIVSEHYVFTCAEPHSLICIDRKTGKIKWSRENDYGTVLGSGKAGQELPRFDWKDFYGFTTPTPVTNGQLVWAVFGHGVVVCYDMEGNLKWGAELSTGSRVAGIAASPVLIGDKLIVCQRKEGTSALNALTGKYAWTSGKGGGGYGSPIPVRIGNEQLVLHPDGILIKAATGQIVVEGMKGGENLQNWGPSASFADGSAFLHFHTKSTTSTVIRAIRLEPVGKNEDVWSFKPTPEENIRGRMGGSHIYADGYIYAIRDDGLMHVLEARSGKLAYEQKMPKPGYASLCKVGPYIYSTSGSTITVFK